MSVAIVTDSTCDLTKEKLDALNVYRVPLYVLFRGETYKDWESINPDELISGVQAGEAMPTTSQPSPQDFEDVFKQAVSAGATEIVCLTISSELSKTIQAANIAAKNLDTSVHIFDSLTASLGLGLMVEYAVNKQREGTSAEAIMNALNTLRDNSRIFFSVGTLDFLQKNGRIGGARAMLGSLLSLKPLLTLVEGKIEPIGRARGSKRALKELVSHIEDVAKDAKGTLHAAFLGIQDDGMVTKLQAALSDAGVSYEDHGTYTLGSVITAHVGPGTFGVCLYAA
ncbi:MAG: DegV family protein [Deinococcota bacterium]